MEEQMDLSLTDEQQMLKQTVRRFAEQDVRPVMKELDQKEEFSVDLTRKMFDLGLFGITVDPDYGGYGMDYLSYCIAVEELARVDGCQAATVAAGNSLGLDPLYYFGNEEQKRRYLPKLCTSHLWGFGLTEPEAGSDAGGTKTTAERDGNEWVINGSKIFITNGANPLTLGATVQAVTGKRDDGRKEYTCFLVEADTPGFTSREMHDKLCWRSSNTAELYFEDVRVPDSAILGSRGSGFRQMLATLDRGRLAIAAMGLGGAQGAMELAIAYAQERRQFGRPIARFQANQFKVADMATEVEAARALLYRACWLKDTGQAFGREAAMSKLYCSEVMHRCANHCVQLHGGYGLMEEYDAAKFYRDQRLLEIGEGTSEVQRLVISRSLLS
jgi:alkylation response protein AidB-like acyl-CoA dehydrogenase